MSSCEEKADVVAETMADLMQLTLRSSDLGATALVEKTPTGPRRFVCALDQGRIVWWSLVSDKERIELLEAEVAALRGELEELRRGSPRLVRSRGLRRAASRKFTEFTEELRRGRPRLTKGPGIRRSASRATTGGKASTIHKDMTTDE